MALSLLFFQGIAVFNLAAVLKVNEKYESLKSLMSVSTTYYE